MGWLGSPKPSSPTRLAPHSTGPKKLFIGVTEILGVIGIIVPYATGILPFLTAWAAIGFAVIMVLAMVVHARERDTRGVIMNVVFFVLSLAVAYGRW